MNTPDKPSLTSSSRAQPRRPDWWRKTLAGAVGGFLLALSLVGIFAWAGPGGISAPDKVQFNMWMITPLWLLIFSLVYLFRTGNRALFWLTVANLISWTLLSLLKAA
ncbi:hypothetical protein ACQUQU_02985 [Thalassolituus sp. LLYu03]|uniref:hypothetical protein n=1 Tax=Thalassolituus sp. LLYu03 TaxID=3421656 RepID=UPI003D2A57EF